MTAVAFLTALAMAAAAAACFVAVEVLARVLYAFAWPVLWAVRRRAERRAGIALVAEARAVAERPPDPTPLARRSDPVTVARGWPDARPLEA